MKLAARPDSLPGDAGQWGCGEPLWKLAPKRDATGKPYVDFMMLAPGLKKRPGHEIEALTRLIQGILARFEEWVVFADFNIKLNVLWVSLKYRPGIMAEIVAALRAQVPELKLVAHNPELRG
ncbi:MAG TPA: hypothetical protein PLL19_13850 [Thiobacillaceae bacterium]|jgi:hypothetical protein|nr:hypothetical protein [Thiobacillaceae bacterium]HNH89289.1 hypothetical protein [Thiobacillaceae bacterium]